MKRYDRAYFDRWYRDPRRRIGAAADLARSVAIAVAVAEQVLQRPVRNVIDVGCGEGRWRAPLRRLRPGLKYLGIDSSEYVVTRWGRTRNIRLGRFGELERCGIDEPADLVVSADVLHYVPTAELRRGLAAVARLTVGIAYLPTFTSRDDIAGDHAGFHRRGPAVYRRIMAGAGLISCGMHCWTPAANAGLLAELERC